MAFRASHKTATKSAKTKKTEEPVTDQLNTVEPVKPAEPSEPNITLSVDDFVGAPVTGEPASPATKKPEEVPSDANRYSRPPIGRPPYRPHSSPRFGQQRGGYSGPSRYPEYNNFRRPYNSNPRYTPRPTFGEPTGYRREWGNNDPAVVHTQDIDVPTETVHGILDIMPEGHGFLRPKFTPSDRDVYISQSQIRRFMLRNGDMVEGQARQPKDNERYWGLLKVEKVNEVVAEGMATRPHFEDLTPIYPNKLLLLETGQTPLSCRMIDLVAPIGFGQRGLIVSPPKAGKTTILKEIAAGIAANYPRVHLMAALIGERPEEVTDLTRSIKGEVLASNFDESPPDQTRVAEVALDRAKRLVEMGKDVVVLLDSITRLARAYNLVVNPSGRTLSGGFDPAALYPAKKFLGAARCVELQPSADSPQPSDEKPKEPQTGGSLTVIGTALVDTGSRMDDLIYEEFKGTGNMELTLSRTLEERRIFPAIDIGKSGTRHDELLLGIEAMKKVTTLRHMLSLLGDEERTMMLVDRLGKTKSNNEFLESLSQG
jgi:transcription termination factor Rho